MRDGLYTLLELYALLVFIRVLLTWIPHDPHNQIIELIARVTDPYLDLFRGLIPARGGIDISPLLALILLQILASAIGHS